MKLSRLFPTSIITNLLHFVWEVVVMVRGYVAKSIRFQLILTFVICSCVSLLVYSISASFFGTVNQQSEINYSSEMNQIDNVARELGQQIERWEQEPQHNPDFAAPVQPTPVLQGTVPTTQQDTNGSGPNKDNSIFTRLEQEYRFNMYKMMLVDLDGKVIYKSKNAITTQIDLFSLLRSAMEERTSYNDSRKEFTSLYPIQYQQKNAYVVVSGIPQPIITYHKGQSPLSLVAALAAFIFLFYIMTQRKMRYIEELADGLKQISVGNLNFRVHEKNHDELGSLAANMNQMAEELQRTIEEERRAERTKNELITNVSHDLRTPLTLIMGYLRLLKDKGYESDQQADGYLNIAYSKSEKLQSLIEDLFDYTKLSNQGITLLKERVSLNELLEQLIEELISMAEDNGLVLVKQLPAERVMVDIDTGKMIRVFENLLTNAIKYSKKPGEIKVAMFKESDYVKVCLSNQGPALSEEELSRLFERFYRVDSSRSSVTGGSGLGLAIAKSIIDAHDGMIWAESAEQEIRFWVKLKLI